MKSAATVKPVRSLATERMAPHFLVVCALTLLTLLLYSSSYAQKNPSPSFSSGTGAGTTIPAFSRFVGTYGASFIANEWYPESRANTSHALLRGSTALSSGLAWNELREFWPDIKNHLHRRKE
jgi:hypothetical protein